MFFIFIIFLNFVFFINGDDESKKLNFLLIVAEDVNAFSVVQTVLQSLNDKEEKKKHLFVENEMFQLPGLVRLHKSGVLFKNSYATSSNCSPSRSSLLTSLYPYVIFFSSFLMFFNLIIIK